MRIRVGAQTPYEVVIGAGATARLGDLIADSSRVAIIHPRPLTGIAERVRQGCGDRLVRLIPVPDAEAAKTPDTLASCWTALAEAGFTRNDVVVGVGGGTATDLAGFVAASWLRGVPYVSVPTTVLGMVDAAVGGKTGINLPAGKNLVGAFHEPRGVLCDLDLLQGLPEPEVRSGLAEVVKCGFIRDARILGLLDAGLDDALSVGSSTFAELVARAVQVKADVVSGDLRERTSVGEAVGREALNYGHTLGHAIEAREGYTWRHGEAIAVGMVFVAEVSRRLAGLDDGIVRDHARLLSAIGLPTTYPEPAWGELRSLMALDKKSRGSALRLVGLKDQGVPVILADPDEQELAAAWATVSRQG